MINRHRHCIESTVIWYWGTTSFQRWRGNSFIAHFKKRHIKDERKKSSKVSVHTVCVWDLWALVCRMRCKLSHPIFPSYKPHREQQNTDPSAVHRPKQPVAVDVWLSVSCGWTDSVNSSCTSSFSVLNLSLSLSQRLVDEQTAASFRPKGRAFSLYAAHIVAPISLYLCVQ